jgi:hypothetical protein
MNDDAPSAALAVTKSSSELTANKCDSVKCDGERAQRSASLLHAVQNAVRQPTSRVFAQIINLDRQLHDGLA